MRVRALELNSSSSIWNPERVIEVLDLMVGVGYNTLVFHEVPVMEELVWPSKFFGAEADEGIHRRYREGYKQYYKYNPRRRPTPYHNLDYMRWVARRANERGIDFYLNNKELYFPDAILELQPQLMKNGCVCPSEPFWEEFIEQKYDELFSDFEELAGTITAPGSGESRLSISSSRCACDLCRQQSTTDWYTRMVNAMHRAAQKHDKKLVIRDFVFDKKAQDELSEAMISLPADITICLKNTPHDYYPTFPDNARIGNVGNHEEWVEFDGLGQYFGWGVSPAVMTADFRRRLAYAREQGVQGSLIRIDWEGLQGHSALKTVNSLNVFACAMLSEDATITNREIYTAWADYENAIRTDLGSLATQDALEWLEQTLESTWPITSRTLFSRDCVFSDSSYIPVSVEHAFWLAEEKNSLHDWDETKRNLLDPTLENVRIAVAEKQDAVDLVHDLRLRVEAGHEGVDPKWLGEFTSRVRTFQQYVELFFHVSTALFGVRHVGAAGAKAAPEVISGTLKAVERLGDLAKELREQEPLGAYPSVLLLNPQRVEVLTEDLVARLREAHIDVES